jgi:hypothetical protein
MRHFIRRYKPVFQSILMILFSTIFFWLSVKGIKDQNINLAQINTFTGEVISTGEKIRHSKQSANVFYLSIKGLPQTLGVYRMSRRYNDLLNEIENGDVLTVYYRQNHSNEINIDLVQIEKEGRVILDKKEFEDKESSLLWIGLIGGLVFVGLSIYNYKKYFIPKKKNAA